MHEEKWSFERLAFSKEMQSFYSQTLSYISLGAFTYIGLYENPDFSVRKCFEILGVPPANTELPKFNITNASSVLNIPDAMRDELRKFHADDYLIMDYARLKFHS